jgi:hypothetical protein
MDPGVTEFYIDRPAAIDIFANAGAFASATMKTTELEFAAELAAAFNRGVAINPAKWHSVSDHFSMPGKNT